MNPNSRTNLLVTYTLTGIRLVIGIFWLLQLTWKPPPTFGCPDGGFCFWLYQVIQHPLIPLMADLLSAIVRPNAILFGWLTTFVEVFIGLHLLFGAFTRLGALVGTLWSIALLSGLVLIPGEAPWLYVFLVLLNLLFVAIGGSGQFSIDRARQW